MKLYASLPRRHSCPGTDRLSSVHDSLEPTWTFLLELQIVMGKGKNKKKVCWIAYQYIKEALEWLIQSDPEMDCSVAAESFKRSRC